jgi:type IV secretion system protein VirB8
MTRNGLQMKSSQQKNSARIDNVVGKGVNFELTITDMARRSERRAWHVASASLLMSLILAGGYFYFLPLKEKVPYLVMADAYTGTSTVARLTGDFNHNRITVSEAVNRSNVAHFVLARESYDAALMNLRDWTTVYTMSAPGVAADYTALHGSRNPDSPFKIYGKEHAIRARILSIVLLGGGPDTVPKGATVRFQRSLFDKATGDLRPMDSKIATLEFSYKNNLSMDEKYRIENPLGFQVTSYRVDEDYAASPPLDTEAMPQDREPMQAAGLSSEATARPVAAPVPAAFGPSAATPMPSASAPASPSAGAGLR